MHWNAALKDFATYLKLEKNLAQNTIDSYALDLLPLQQWAEAQQLTPLDLQRHHLEAFIQTRLANGLAARSQARLVSALRGFFKFLVMEGQREDNPARLLEQPKLPRKLPQYLTPEEVDRIIQAVDLSHPLGERNRAMVELLFSCGLRVSELTQLRVADLFAQDHIIRVTGKGNKQRLVPINDVALTYIKLYQNEVRKHQKVQKGEDIYLFLNQHGHRLTRAMIFTIVRKLARVAGIATAIGPHTFRHSFATALVNHGADLRSVQEMMGHASILTTEIYAHLKQEKVRQAVDLHPLKKKTQ
jgi:integrase/recombinase XerD